MTEQRLPQDHAAGLEQALQGALQRALPAPALPANFRARLHAAVARSATADPRQRQQLERELQLRLAELRKDYLSLRRRTLGSLVGGAFVGGIVFALAWPWLSSELGSLARFALPVGGAAVGIGLGASVWLRRSFLARLLD
ncbi:MAG TPA: hypothetical protein VMI92_06595 [Steroidobacteraceae bacterium]|nr:hypothetical protein [Steroidobacteraceae bacterium]